MLKLIAAGCCVSLISCGIIPRGGPVAGVAAGSQTEIVLKSIGRGKVVIVDKRAATVTAYENSKKQFSFPALMGSVRKDGFDRSRSAFLQKVTPAIYYKNPQVMYNPRFPSMYKERAVINFDDINQVGKTFEVLSFHTTLTSANDRNVTDGTASNNRISNGCIRIRHDDFLKLAAFMSPGSGLSQLRDAQKKGEPINLRSTSVIVILPEEDRSAAGTKRTLGL